MCATSVRSASTPSGWDPVHEPDTDRQPADVVNLGYVVNVIEDREERAKTLRSAWTLATGVLIVSARLDWEPAAKEGSRTPTVS